MRMGWFSWWDVRPTGPTIFVGGGVEGLAEIRAGQAQVLGKDEALRLIPGPVAVGDYSIAWTALARQALGYVPEKAGSAVVEFCYGSLAASPYRAGKPLRLGMEGLHSARRGDYRVVYRIDDQARRVDIVAVEHRADVYRPRQF